MNGIVSLSYTYRYRFSNMSTITPDQLQLLLDNASPSVLQLCGVALQGAATRRSEGTTRADKDGTEEAHTEDAPPPATVTEDTERTKDMEVGILAAHYNILRMWIDTQTLIRICPLPMEVEAELVTNTASHLTSPTQPPPHCGTPPSSCEISQIIFFFATDSSGRNGSAKTALNQQATCLTCRVPLSIPYHHQICT